MFSMAFNVRNNWSSALYVASFYICIPAPCHPVQIKVVMCLRHGVQDPLVPRKSCKGLFTAQCLHVDVVFHILGGLYSSWQRRSVFMAGQVKAVDDFLKV